VLALALALVLVLAPVLVLALVLALALPLVPAGTRREGGGGDEARPATCFTDPTGATSGSRSFATGGSATAVGV
jgi:hypothetical protein